MANRVLVVEDSKEIFTMVERALNLVTELTWASSLEKAEKALSESSFDLILLDIELPDGNGIEFCYKIQEKYPTLPVFFLTSHDDLSEKVLGFSAGAEDYIVKPFNPLELKARVESKLKKAALLLSKSDALSWKELSINKNRQEVKIFESESEEKSVDLTALEFKILIYFSNRVEEVIPRDEILDSIWGKDVHVYARSVDTHVSKLRKKLGDVAHVIESVHGVGYKFKPTPTS